MIIDLLIIAFGISALYRGREIGFVRQFYATVGFFGGLFFGAFVQPHVTNLVHTENARAFLAVMTTLGCAILFLTIGEYIGIRLKRRLEFKRINRFDTVFGAGLNVISLLLSTWLVAALLVALPLPQVQHALQNSRIISGLNRLLPDAPRLVADLGNLINPNGFPDVFIGNEPIPNTNIDLPSLGELQPAVEQTRNSVVKVAGQGCGGVVDGSGFVVGPGLVATNAHVVAGIKQPYVQDTNGTHKATAVWFDPNLDFAILRTSDLAGQPLTIATTMANRGTAAVVLGYPGGGAFSAKAAVILDQFTASGRNIYGRGHTDRDIYEIHATVIPGNSGGPLIAKDGTVIGVIFAESTSYQNVGYALTSSSVTGAIKQAKITNQQVSTGRCAE
jgi:S1-C subfamily serine protease